MPGFPAQWHLCYYNKPDHKPAITSFTIHQICPRLTLHLPHIHPRLSPRPQTPLQLFPNSSLDSPQNLPRLSSDLFQTHSRLAPHSSLRQFPHTPPDWPSDSAQTPPYVSQTWPRLSLDMSHTLPPELPQNPPRPIDLPQNHPGLAPDSPQNPPRPTDSPQNHPSLASDNSSDSLTLSPDSLRFAHTRPGLVWETACIFIFVSLYFYPLSLRLPVFLELSVCLDGEMLLVLRFSVSRNPQHTLQTYRKQHMVPVMLRNKSNTRTDRWDAQIKHTKINKFTDPLKRGRLKSANSRHRTASFCLCADLHGYARG